MHGVRWNWAMQNMAYLRHGPPPSLKTSSIVNSMDSLDSSLDSFCDKRLNAHLGGQWWRETLTQPLGFSSTNERSLRHFSLLNFVVYCCTLFCGVLFMHSVDSWAALFLYEWSQAQESFHVVYFWFIGVNTVHCFFFMCRSVPVYFGPAGGQL